MLNAHRCCLQFVFIDFDKVHIRFVTFTRKSMKSSIKLHRISRKKHTIKKIIGPEAANKINDFVSFFEGMSNAHAHVE